MQEPTVVFATDLDGDVLAGLGLASRLAAEHAATLVLLHVVPLRASDSVGMLHDATRLVSGDSERRLRALRPTDPTVPYLHLLEAGEPEAVVLQVLRRERAHFLVIEESPRSALARGLTRSLAERLVLAAPCPVVVYRPGAGPGADPEPTPAAEHDPQHPVEVLDLLTGLLDARVEALVSWMDHERDAVARLASSPALVDAVATLAQARRGEARTTDARVAARLGLELDEHRRALGALGVELRCGGEVLVHHGALARDPAARTAFDAEVQADGTALSLPLEGEGERPVPLVMLAGARVALPTGPDAALVFALDARRTFLRILAQPGPTPSVETYAFDRNGLMLSNSRFPSQLRRMGLLPADAGTQTPRRLRVCEPVDTSEGRPAPSPLTRAAADAVQGHDGADLRGYRDYRGIEVIGAWRWVPRYGFGVAAEMDR